MKPLNVDAIRERSINTSSSPTHPTHPSHPSRIFFSPPPPPPRLTTADNVGKIRFPRMLREQFLVASNSKANILGPKQTKTLGERLRVN